MPDPTPSRPAQPLPTTARLSLGRTGTTVATREHLHFQLDHALARDAVHTPLDTVLLERGLRQRGLTPLLLRSNSPDRATYLRRPDLGRTLHPDSITALQQSVIGSAGAGHNTAPQNNAVILSGGPELAEGPESKNPESACPAQTAPQLSAPEPEHGTLFLLADGLSSLALERHALPLLDVTLPLLPTPYSLFPVLTNARVALADHIGHILGAEITVLLIGERPGLSSPDSLGCYITWNPQPGRTTDAERNCISNIRGPEGLSYAEAAHRIAHYIAEAQRLQTTGVALKDPEVDQGGRHSLRG